MIDLLGHWLDMDWTKVNGKCKYCGEESVEIDYNFVLTSIPPQYWHRCNNCGKEWAGQDDSGYFPDIEYPNTFPKIEWGQIPCKENYQEGWVCPKCGRVYSPDVNQCFYCGNHGFGAPIQTSIT